MLKREFKINLKSFAIWTGILIVMFLLIYILYPFMFTEETTQNLEQMIQTFPPDLIKAFNMDLSSIDTAYGWLKSEGFVYVLVVIGIYAAILGSNIVLKEENDKTIEYLSQVPITRSKIMTNKVVVGLTYIVAMTLVLGIFNYIALLLVGDFDHLQYILLSITPLFVALPLFAIMLFISTFLHKTKAATGISLGLVFLFYILNMISELSDKVDYFRYFSIYTLADIRNVISDVSINPVYVLISLGITVIFIVLSYIRYNKKELV